MSRFWCSHCDIELFDAEADAIGAGWTDGADREIVTCPECGNESGGLDRDKGGEA